MFFPESSANLKIIQNQHRFSSISEINPFSCIFRANKLLPGFGHCSAESLLTGHCRELARRDGTQVTQPRAGAQSPHRASTVSVSPLAAGCRRSTALALMVKQRARQYRSTWEAGLNYGSAHCLLTTVCPLTRHL